MTANNHRRSRRLLRSRMKWFFGVLVIVVIGAPAVWFHAIWLPKTTALFARATGASAASGDHLEEVEAHDHSHHDEDDHDSASHDSDEHAHAHGDEEPEDADTIHLSAQARKNIGLTTTTITLQSYQRTTTVPAIVIGRPGRALVQVVAPLGGRVTRLYAVEGEAVVPGQRLFDLRLTHEELVQAQSSYLRTAEELDVVAREIQRLKSVNVPGAIPGKTVREREYEQQKLQAMFNAQRQSLLLHGLTTEQVDSILRSRKLVRDITVVAPAHPLDGHATPPTDPFTVRKLQVVLGQYVDAGATLCELGDYCQLYIQGRAFEQDDKDLLRAAQHNWKVGAICETDSARPHVIDGLTLLYVENEVDPASRALYFYVALPNRQVREYTTSGGHRFVTWQYKPGQRMQLRVPVEMWHQRIVLPVDAVARDGIEYYVFRQRGDALERVPVHVEYQDQLNVVVENDGAIVPGDVVATHGAHQLQMALKNKTGGGADPHAGHNHG